MGNWIDCQLSVLAADPAEINQIEPALKEPSDELLRWAAGRVNKSPEEIAADVKELVSFAAVRNLGFVHPSVNKARRFKNGFKDRFWGTVMSHLVFASEKFPTAIFLLEYWDAQWSYAGKMVIRAGEEIQHVRDDKQQAQAQEWLLPNIFAPYWAEYQNGLEFGSLWGQWVTELAAAVRGLEASTSTPHTSVTAVAEELEDFGNQV